MEPGARARRDQPACRTSRCSRRAGSHGELAGVLLTRAYHEDRGETRTKVLTPDTAHGTNPATVTMAGLEVVKVGTNARRRRRPRRPAREGRRRRRLPHAHEPEHARDLRREHRGDRARSCTASARRSTTTARTSTRSWASRARATWASTSCTSTCTSRSPSRTAAAARLRADRGLRPHRARTCMHPRIVRRSTTAAFDLDDDRPKSIGRLRGFQGNYGCFVRSYAYIRSLGAEGLKDASARPPCSTPTTCSRGCGERRAEHLPLAYGERCACTSSSCPARR